MKINRIRIQNFKSICSIHLTNLENALILVGKNSTGKTTILDAVRAVSGDYRIGAKDFRENHPDIVIEIALEITEEDLKYLYLQKKVSRMRDYENWLSEFQEKLPSFQENLLEFTYTVSYSGEIIYSDGIALKEETLALRVGNPYLKEVFPKVYYLDSQRDISKFQSDLLLWMENDMMKEMRADHCMLKQKKNCDRCFDCIEHIEKKSTARLNAFETAKLLEYKLYQINLDDFSKNMNENFHRNGGQEEIIYSMGQRLEAMMKVKAESMYPGQSYRQPVEQLSKGMRSVYMLSLMETYAQGKGENPGIIIVEEPEIYLHPQMQRTASEILYRLSKKNQVMFTTHSANILHNFNSRQIRQIVLKEDGCSKVVKHTDISRILDDLGYSASDLMNVDFVFIVEGKQDQSRLPILLNKYYAESCDSEGRPSRISIIATNSCTNIKTYANLKYMNQMYLKDHFLMIRDGDGKNPKELKRELCTYYEERSRAEGTKDALPRVKPKNVLILKYYSFENYFLNPELMVKVGVLQNEEEFYEKLLKKWKEQLRFISSGKALTKVLGKEIQTVEDLKENMEAVKIHLRGHNLFDLFYARLRKSEREILRKYVEIAPREEFADILDAIDRFIYFENRRSEV